MKQYLVKLNRPVLINETLSGIQYYQAVYGFLVPYPEKEEINGRTRKDILSYVRYLAAIHELSAGCTDEFRIGPHKQWIDKEGKGHGWDSWAEELAQRCAEKIGLDYSLVVIDTDGLSGICPDCGISGNYICCGNLMESLSRKAEEQDELYNVLLFNRPVWLPNEALCQGEKGHSHFYGIITKRKIGGELIETGNLYLGYLAMCEEYGLNGMTPSGYKAENDDMSIWIDKGEKNRVGSDKIIRETLLCLKKHCLRISRVIAKVPGLDVEEGVRGCHIVSKKLYESLQNTKDGNRG